MRPNNHNNKHTTDLIPELILILQTLYDITTLLTSQLSAILVVLRSWWWSEVYGIYM